MSDRASRRADAERVRRAIEEQLLVHVRIADQGHAPQGDECVRLSRMLPDLSAFADNEFDSVKALLDWDHQIPSQYVILRVLGCYTPRDSARVEGELRARREEIDDGNLFPEFDVPDFADIEGNETYAAVLRPGSTDIEDFRFLSAWRKQVDPSVADKAVRIVRNDPGYERTASSRATMGLGGPVVIGWAPPCLADTETWAIEVWLLTEFDGQSGKARVFMVDLDGTKVSREFDTDVQLA